MDIPWQLVDVLDRNPEIPRKMINDAGSNKDRYYVLGSNNKSDKTGYLVCELGPFLDEPSRSGGAVDTKKKGDFTTQNISSETDVQEIFGDIPFSAFGKSPTRKKVNIFDIPEEERLDFIERCLIKLIEIKIRGSSI